MKMKIKQMILSCVSGFSLLVISLSAISEELVVALAVERSDPMFEVGRHFKERIEEATNGYYNVVLLGTEVGGERDQLEGASSGEYDITISGSMPITLYAPRYVASDLPFVYSSSEQARAVYSGDIGEALRERILESGNMHLVGLTARTPRNLTSNMPIKDPADIQGVRMRVPEIESWVTVWNDIGAQPSPIAWPEVYTSLQTNVIAMQENPVDFIYAGRIHEVQSHLNRTEHVYSFYHWMMSDDFYQTVPEDMRADVLAVVTEAAEWGDQFILDGQSKFYSLLEDAGMTIVDSDAAAFRAAAAPSIRRLAESLEPEVAEYILSLLD